MTARLGPSGVLRCSCSFVACVPLIVFSTAGDLVPDSLRVGGGEISRVRVLGMTMICVQVHRSNYCAALVHQRIPRHKPHCVSQSAGQIVK
jgi:hypothetical protein